MTSLVLNKWAQHVSQKIKNRMANNVRVATLSQEQIFWLFNDQILFFPDQYAENLTVFSLSCSR